MPSSAVLHLPIFADHSYVFPESYPNLEGTLSYAPPMENLAPDALHAFMADDHRQIEALLDQATAVAGRIEEAPYARFRIRLLTHIKMEEKILFLAAQKANGGYPLPLQTKLKRDHGAITALMVCPPSEALILVLRHVLDEHDRLEEEEGGMYAACETLTQGQREKILQDLRSVTPVPVHPFNPAPYALDVAKRALIRAGYDYDQLVEQLLPPS